MTNIIIVPLLAFTWIVGLFAVGGQKIYVILFVLANVLQVKRKTVLLQDVSKCARGHYCIIP